MSLTVARRSLLPFVLALLLSAAYVADAGATRIGLTTFKTSIDVDLKLTQHTKFTGERPGCFAPFENWDREYTLDIDSKPTRKSKIVNGTTTLTDYENGTGTTYSFGAKNSFKQNSSGGGWELQTQNPPNCDAAPPVPSWAVSPTCKKISERVSATLVESGTDGTSAGDGLLQLMRQPKAKPTGSGASIGASCLRILHDPDTSTADAVVGVGLKSTMLTIPIGNIKGRLEKLAKGDANDHPSFTTHIRYWSKCNFFGISPHPNQKTSWTPMAFSQPHEFLGSFNPDGSNSSCTLNGSGTVTVRREGKVTRI